MEKLKFHESRSDNIIVMLLGEDKFHRVADKVLDIVKDPANDTYSKQLEKALYSYADNTQEAIGIALLVRGARNYITEKVDRLMGMLIRSNGIPDLVSAIGKATGIETPISDSMRGTSNTTEMIVTAMPDEALKDYAERIDCNDCRADGDCEIQRELDKRGISYRKGDA